VSEDEPRWWLDWDRRLVLVPDEPELESLPDVRELPVSELPVDVLPDDVLPPVVLPLEPEPVPDPVDPVLPDDVPLPVPVP